MNIFQKLFACLRLHEAIRKADEAYRINRRRFFVLPGPGKSLLIMDRSNFRILKRKGYIDSRALTRDALIESFYFTPCADGSEAISVADRNHKVKQYLSWYQSRLKLTEKTEKQVK